MSWNWVFKVSHVKEQPKEQPKVGQVKEDVTLNLWESDYVIYPYHVIATGCSLNVPIHLSYLLVNLTEVEERAVTNFALWLQTCHPLDLILYTDGSQEVDQDGEKTKAGAGWVVKRADKWFYLNGCSLGKGAEVCDAEATAIVYGFQAALASPMA